MRVLALFLFVLVLAARVPAQYRPLAEVVDASQNALWLAREEAGWILQLDPPSGEGPAFYFSAAQMDALRRAYQLARAGETRQFTPRQGVTLQAAAGQRLLLRFGSRQFSVQLQGQGANAASFETLLSRAAR